MRLVSSCVHLVRTLQKQRSREEQHYLVIKSLLIMIQDMVMAVDKDGTGSIDFPEFLAMMALKVSKVSNMHFSQYLLLF